MDYIRELNAFDKWLNTNHLPALSQLLWYKLFMLFNGAGWPKQIVVENARLMAMIQLKNEKSFIEYRNNLVIAGLIMYEKGGKGRPGKYRLNSLVCTCDLYLHIASRNDNINDSNTPVETTVETPENCQTYINKNKKENENKKENKENRDIGQKSLKINILGENAEKNAENMNPQSVDNTGFGRSDLHIASTNDNRNDSNTPVETTVDFFNLFWSAYPRKVAKKAAEKAWDKLKLNQQLFDELMAGLMTAKNSKQWQDPKYIPHPATWLNGERWKDEMEVNNGASSRTRTSNNPNTKPNPKTTTTTEGERLKQQTAGINIGDTKVDY